MYTSKILVGSKSRDVIEFATKVLFLIAIVCLIALIVILFGPLRTTILYKILGYSGMLFGALAVYYFLFFAVFSVREDGKTMLGPILYRMFLKLYESKIKRENKK